MQHLLGRERELECKPNEYGLSTKPSGWPAYNTPGYGERDSASGYREFRYSSDPRRPSGRMRGRLRTRYYTPGNNGLNEPLVAEMKDLKEDLDDSPTVAIKKNSETFERRFKILEYNITNEMQRIAGREGDRVIGEVLSGPHDRIFDPVRLVIGDLQMARQYPHHLHRTCTKSGRTWYSL